MKFTNKQIQFFMDQYNASVNPEHRMPVVESMRRYLIRHSYINKDRTRIWLDVPADKTVSMFTETICVDVMP